MYTYYDTLVFGQTLLKNLSSCPELRVRSEMSLDKSGGVLSKVVITFCDNSA